MATATTFAQEGSKKEPVPDLPAQTKAQALINDIFAEDFQKATTPEAKTKLAEYLFKQGKESTDSSANRYMLYWHTQDLAARAGNIHLAMQAITALDKQFAIDALPMKTKALSTASRSVQSPERARTVLDLAMRMLNRAVDDDDYPVADKLGTIAYDAARKAKSIKLASMVKKRLAEVKVLRMRFAKLQVHLDQLKTNPDDAEANLAMATYFGLLKNNWRRALPMFAKGSDPELKRLAKQDLANPTTAAGRLAVADGWWNLARTAKDKTKEHVQQRAAYWYNKAVGDLAGLNRTKALRRMEQVTQQGVTTPVTGTRLGSVGKIRELTGHTQEIKGIDFSPGGRFAVSGGVDETVRFWDLQTGKELWSQKSHNGQVWDVAYHPKAQWVASSSWDSTARLWDAKTGKQIRQYKHPIDVNGIGFSRDGKYMLVGCDDRFMQLWEVDTGKEIRQFTGPTEYVYGVAFSPDGRYVACGSKDGTARVYDRQTGRQLYSFNKHVFPVQHVRFSQDSRYLFSCGDKAVYQFDLTNGKETRRFDSPKGGRITTIDLSRDGRRLLTGDNDRMVRLWDTVTGKLLHTLKGHTSDVSAVAISADGRYALSGGVDQTIILWGLPK